MSNSAQLLVHNIRARQSLSIQAKRDGQRQDFKREQRGVPQTHTHMHTCTHSMQQLQSKHNNPALPRSTGGCQGVQWRATVSTWELVKQHNPNKTKKKGGNCWAGRGISFQAQPPHLRPWWMHTDLWSCAIPGMLWWPTGPISAMFLKPHHQKVKIQITSAEAKEIRRIFTG